MPGARVSGGVTAVVGAGIAGLTAARALADAGRLVTVFEKARGVGGRTSTRRAPPWAFDHGAQYFTAESKEFKRAVEGWMKDRVVTPWKGRLAEIRGGEMNEYKDKRVRYIGTPGMNAVCKRLAHGLDVQREQKIVRIEDSPTGWQLVDEQDRSSGPFETVLVATPPEQAVSLLQAAPRLAMKADGVRSLPCCAALLGFAEPLGLSFDGAFVYEPPLAWIMRNNAKPRRPVAAGGEAWILHATPGWSAAHLNAEPTETLLELIEGFRVAAGRNIPEPRFATSHGWRYAMVAEPLGEPCLWDDIRRIGACGDWCQGARVESAWQSGTALAERALR